MRINQKKVDEVVLSILGEEGASFIKYLYGKQNVSEFELANKTKKDIKVVRKMLYALNNHNLVGFTRKKDKEKGWYIYYWTLIPDNVMYLYVKRRRELLVKLKSSIEDENELFFICQNRCVRLNFDQAMEFEFHCPECGELVLQDEKQDIERIKKQIGEIEEELSSLEKEKKSRKAKVMKRKAKPAKIKRKLVKIKKKNSKK
jgi:transcription initiation factor TFIIE subunit alpha